MTPEITMGAQKMAANSDGPRIYVACLAAYTAGKLHGAWVDCVDADAVHEGIAAMLKSSPVKGEEYAIHDHEGFGGYKVGEHENVDALAAIGAAIEDKGEIFGEYLGHGIHADPKDAGDVAEIVSAFEEEYQGAYRSEEEFAEQLVDDLGMLQGCPEDLKNYFDYERYARDLFMGGYWSTDFDGQTHVFRSA